MNGVQSLVEADLDGGEVVVAATDGETFSGDSWVVDDEGIDDLGWRHGGLLREAFESVRNDDGAIGGASGDEEAVGLESGAGAMGVPFMFEQVLIGVDVFVSGGVRGAGGVGAIFGVGAIVVLRPKAVEDECVVRGALGGVRVGVAEFGRPGEVEEVIVETGAGGEGVWPLGGRAGIGGWVWRRGLAGSEQEKREGGE